MERVRKTGEERDTTSQEVVSERDGGGVSDVRKTRRERGGARVGRRQRERDRQRQRHTETERERETERGQASQREKERSNERNTEQCVRERERGSQSGGGMETER